MYKAFNNWKVVLLSLFGATTFWFFNALNKDYDAQITYPVKFIFDKEHVVVMEPLPQNVIIDVSGGGWNLLRKTFWYTVTPIEIQMDNPSEISYFTRSSLMPVIADQLNILRINSVVTDTLHIHIENKISKLVALKIDSLGIPLAENHRIVSPISIEPDSVELIGPKSVIDTISMVRQIVLPISNISSAFNRPVQVVPSNKYFLSASPKAVNVYFDVLKFERKAIQIAVEKFNFEKNTSLVLKDSLVQVFYTVSSAVNDSYKPNDFAVSVDLNMMQADDSTVMAILMYYPEDVQDVEVIPENMEITRKK